MDHGDEAGGAGGQDVEEHDRAELRLLVPVSDWTAPISHLEGQRRDSPGTMLRQRIQQKAGSIDPLAEEGG